MAALNQTFPLGSWRQISRRYLDGAHLSRASSYSYSALLLHQRVTEVIHLVETIAGVHTARLASVRAVTVPTATILSLGE